MADRVCTRCWTWFPAAVGVCPKCGDSLTAPDAAPISPDLVSQRPAQPHGGGPRRLGGRTTRWLRRTLAVTILLVVTLGAFPAPQLGLWGNPGCSLPGTTCTRVLFIGNSYTYVNDLPTTFANVAWAGGHRVDTGSLAPGGSTLAEHLAAPVTATTLRATRWNVVVLQEQSQMPETALSRADEMYPAATKLVGMIRTQGETPMFYLTFAHEDGDPTVGLPDYQSMQEAIDEGYLGIAEPLGVAVAPVGDAWRTVVSEPSHPALWLPDGSHPTVGGTYLAACVFYSAIFHESPVGLSDDDGLPVAEARNLQAVAASTVFGDLSKWGLPASSP